MPMVLQALYRVVSLWWLLLTLRVAVAEVALSVALVARPLRALLRFTASLMLLMLLIVDVGPCVGGQWLVFGGGLPLFPGRRWLVPLALTGRVCSRCRWCGPLMMPLVRVLQAMPRVMSSVRVVLVAPVVWVPLVTVWRMGSCAMLWWGGCCCGWFQASALVSSGRGFVVCWFTGCGGVGCLWCRRLPVATLMAGWCWRWCS